MKKNLGLVIVALSLVSVGWAGSPAAQNGVVITTNPDFVEDCEYVGEIRAGSSWGGLTMKKVAEKKTYKKLSKPAAEAGMDIVLVHDSKVGFGGSRAQATGYICEPIVVFTTTSVIQTFDYPTGSTKGQENVPPGTNFRVYLEGPNGWFLTNHGWIEEEHVTKPSGGENSPE